MTHYMIDTEPNKNRQELILGYFALSLLQYSENRKENSQKILPTMKKAWKYLNAEIIATQKYSEIIQDINDLLRILNIPLQDWPIDWKIALHNPEFAFLDGNGINLDDFDDAWYDLSANDFEKDFWQQIIIFEIFEKCRNLKEKGEQVYSKIREFIVRHPYVFQSELQEFLGEIGVDWMEIFMNKIYIQIPAVDIRNGEITVCSYCGQPLNPVKQPHNSWKCVQNNYIPKKIAIVEKVFQVNSAIRQYMVIPGIPEVKLYDRLLKRFGKHISVELYPQLDLADIRVNFSDSYYWMIDLKDYRYPDQLAQKINNDQENGNVQDVKYVFGDYLLKFRSSYKQVIISKIGEDFSHTNLFSINEICDQISQIVEVSKNEIS